MSSTDVPEYPFHDTEPTWGSQYLWPAVKRIVAARNFAHRRAFELGSGNGAAANMLHDLGFDVTAVDPSESGIGLASKAFPQCKFALASGYDDLAGRFGRFDLVLSLEVLQHCANSRKILQRLFDLVEPGGILIISVTYHGYLKNLMLALSGRFDRHLGTLWDNGPLRFFSVKTLTALMEETGFVSIECRTVGRVPYLGKSIVATASKR